MSSNTELLKKADLAIGDLASGGLLNPEQSNTFLRRLIEQPTILREARVIPMTANERIIDKIGFDSRILRAATSATPLSGSDRAKPDLSKITLTNKEVIAEVRIPYDVIEDNIEQGGIGGAPAGDNIGEARGGIKDTIMSLMAERASADLEELALNGDTNSGDTFLALQDGWLKLANVNVVDNLNAPIDKLLFKKGKKAMPDKYLRNMGAMRHWVSVDQETEYRDTLSDRQTGLGDNLITGRNPIFAYGTPVAPVSFMPEAKGIFTWPMNLLWGIQRQVTVEAAKDITARIYIIVLTMRVAIELEEADAVVRYDNIGS